MKYTHLDTLPKIIQRAIIEDDYDRGELTDISVTELIDSPRIFALRRKHKDSIISDARMAVHSLIGRAVHKYLQGFARGTDIAEQRLYATIDGITLSGSMDIQEEEDGFITISDYKTWKVEKLRYPHHELEKQLNCYAYLAEKNGKKVKAVQGIIILKDWSGTLASSSLFYPQSPVTVLPVPLKGMEETSLWIRERIALFRPYLDKPIQQIKSICSDEELWGVGDNVRSRKRKDDKGDSIGGVSVEGHDDQIKALQLGAILKVGQERRCKGNYCGVAQFCDQYKERLRLRNELNESVSAYKRSKEKGKQDTEGQKPGAEV